MSGGKCHRYANQYGATAKPRVDLRLGMNAEPLLRLLNRADVVDDWLGVRRGHLEDKLVPELRLRPIGPAGFTGMCTDAIEFAKARHEFDSRVLDDTGSDDESIAVFVRNM